ncbi:thioredoxin [Schaalia sp. 19OD2882]|uniref:DsbA family protein n=1 Tax=Schaalia sp. 19OD2882 TaxID=2794089 RepID=UPI001C1E985C|nr:thioredoxin [Schaalia sp. 19OD2882]QWW19309.1 thioredoxin [Schaalia sp. 19OD2882]
MAKSRPSSDAVRAKAQQMREAQARKDRTTRMLIIGVVAALVLAVVATVAVVIFNRLEEERRANSFDPAVLFGSYASGAPILVSREGVGKADPKLPTVHEYFDYTCHICADLDVAAGTQISDAAVNGEFNIAYVPVRTVDAAYHHVATGAVLVVAQEAPEHFLAFHHALLAYFQTQYKANDGTVVSDNLASWRKVKEIAASVGVPSEVTDNFPGAGVSKAYLDATTAAWGATRYQGRAVNDDGSTRYGTPEFAAGGVIAQYTSLDKDTVLAAIRAIAKNAPAWEDEMPQSGAAQSGAAQSGN